MSPGTALALSLMLAWSSPALAQSPTEADETFRLDIGEKRITERDYEASKQVELPPTRGVELKVGAAVKAEQIDVLLREVHGQVRFRASLAEIVDLIQRHQNRR